MDKLQNKEILLSFAAFVYYTEKKNYKVQRHLDGYISFWFDKDRDEHQILQITTNTVEYDCGYVVINSRNVLDDLFRDISNDDDYNDFVDNLTLCEREYGPDKGEVVLLHCKIPPSERKNIKTKINSGEIIKCLHKHKP